MISLFCIIFLFISVYCKDYNMLNSLVSYVAIHYIWQPPDFITIPKKLGTLQ